jgi:ubiquitin-like protein Pup
MASQEQQRPSRRSETEEVEHEPLPGGSAAGASATTSEDDVDDLLDEIDDVLETNAEQFVRQYTQKGGQ